VPSFIAVDYNCRRYWSRQSWSFFFRPHCGPDTAIDWLCMSQTI